MDKAKEIRALDYARRVGLPYNDIKYCGEWKGFTVYKGYFDKRGEDVSSGPPLYVLEKAGEFRITSVKECYEVLDSLISKNA